MLTKIGGSCFTKWSRVEKIASSLFYTKIYADKATLAGLDTNLDFTSKYDEQETKRILGVLNETDVGELVRYNISQKRVKYIAKYREKNGPFTAIEQVLKVDDFGAKVLERFVSSIVQGPVMRVKDSDPRKSIRVKHEVSTPVLSDSKRKNIQTITSVTFGLRHVSWAKMNPSGQLLSWQCSYNFQWPKKDDPMEIHELALIIRDKLPESDIYVTELPPTTKLMSGHQNVSGLLTEQRIQLIAMMTALLASKYNDPSELDKPCLTSLENVYFLRRNIAARLFKLVIGDEIVSALAVMDQIIENDLPESLKHIPPIKIDYPEIEIYDNSNMLQKEALGQALLCSAAFVFLALQQNVPSLRAIRQDNPWKKYG